MNLAVPTQIALKDCMLCMVFRGNPYDDDTNPHVRLLIVKKLLPQALNKERA